MTLGSAQAAALRFGAVMMVIASVALGVVALTVSGDPGGTRVRPVTDPEQITLPDPGLFGGGVVVYGAADQPGVPPDELGCRLLRSSGTEQSSAKLSDLSVLQTPPVSSQGTRLQPLFEVSSYTDGSVVACDDLASVAPVVVAAPSTFGGLGSQVRALAAAGAAICLVVGLLGLVLLRPQRRR